jgi:hypothetical protein
MRPCLKSEKEPRSRGFRINGAPASGCLSRTYSTRLLIYSLIMLCPWVAFVYGDKAMASSVCAVCARRLVRTASDR